MKHPKQTCSLFIWILLCTACYIPAFGQANQNIQFTNGNWFTDDGFESASFFSVDGILSDEEPARIDTVIDLGNKYIIPPFGEAHNHNITSEWTLNAQTPRYFKDGIFYVKIPGTITSRTTPIRELVNQPATLDVVFGSPGITSPGKHPEPLYRRLASTGVIPGLDADNLDGDAFFTAASVDELEKKWPSILAGKPDFIKAFLLFANHENISNAGLQPDVYRRAVQLAHETGLRVTTHIESAADFALAVDAGSDEIAHLPGYFFRSNVGVEAYLVDESTAHKAAEQGIVVVTTGLYSRVNQDSAQHAQAREIQTHNLRLLFETGVPIAIGTDITEATSLDEAKYLQTLKVFDNLVLLKLWSETTPVNIFPDRKIGRLQSGYEASFLVLDCNPVDDFECVSNISLRVKQGVLLEITNN